MRATGIVRRIDDLGRVVIPKEIRRTMKLKESQSLEIYTGKEGEIVLKKYSPIGELAAFSSQYADTLYKTCGLAIIISDRDAVIACAGVSRKEYGDKRLSDELEKIISGRGLYVYREGEEQYPVIAEGGSHCVRCAMPILTEGDIIGCVISVFSPEDDRTAIEPELEAKLVQTAAGFLGRQLES